MKQSLKTSAIWSFTVTLYFLYIFREEQLQAAWPSLLKVTIGSFILVLMMSTLIDLLRIESNPGRELLYYSERLFPTRTFQEILEPSLRDLFDEYRNAISENRPWEARAIKIRGYLSFWSAAFAYLLSWAAKAANTIWKATR